MAQARDPSVTSRVSRCRALGPLTVAYCFAMGSDGGKRFAGTQLWVAQLVVFSALGWLVAGILDGVGALRLGDALFVAGLLLALVAGLLFLEGNDMPVAFGLRTSPVASMAGVANRAGLGVPLSRAQALAVVSAAVAAGELIVAAALVK